MFITRYGVAFFATAIVFCALDAVWLMLIATDFYREQLGSLLRAEPDLTAAALFYVLYLVGLQIFAVLPASERGSLRRAAVLGALFGLFTYMTYDLTNMATLRGWPWRVVAVDIAWGMAVSAAAATAGCFAWQKLTRWQQLLGARKV